MDSLQATLAQQIADAAKAFQLRSTGHAPKSVSVSLSDHTLVITLLEALTPAEKILAQSPAGAAQVQEFHRQLFASSSGPLRDEIKRILGIPILEAAAEIVPSTGTVVHAFTTGNMVQIFQLARHVPAEIPGLTVPPPLPVPHISADLADISPR